jgi:hypothetical protein
MRYVCKLSGVGCPPRRIDFLLQQQSQVKHCTSTLVRRDLHRLAQAFDGDFRTALLVD